MSTSTSSNKKIVAFLCLGIILISGLFLAFKFYSFSKNKLNKTPDRPIVRGIIKRDYTFTNQHGEQVSIADLAGKVCVASYIYTACPKGCIGNAVELKKLQEKFSEKKDAFHFISVSLDPENDTPENLQHFAQAHGIGKDNWWLLTGKKDLLNSFSLNELQLAPPIIVTDPKKRAEIGPFDHETAILLIDAKRQLRGVKYHLFHDDPWLANKYYDKLIQDIQWLLDHPGE